jgi:hypothetical protein
MVRIAAFEPQRCWSTELIELCQTMQEWLSRQRSRPMHREMVPNRQIWSALSNRDRDTRRVRDLAASQKIHLKAWEAPKAA